MRRQLRRPAGASALNFLPCYWGKLRPAARGCQPAFAALPAGTSAGTTAGSAGLPAGEGGASEEERRLLRVVRSYPWSKPMKKLAIPVSILALAALGACSTANQPVNNRPVAAHEAPIVPQAVS